MGEPLPQIPPESIRPPKNNDPSPSKGLLAMPEPVNKSPYDLIYENDNPETPAYGWIQHKGTDICMDIHCICGTHGHIDSAFTYAIKCLDCGRKYAVGQNIKLIPLDTPELLEASEKHHNDYREFSDE